MLSLGLSFLSTGLDNHWTVNNVEIKGFYT